MIGPRIHSLKLNYCADLLLALDPFLILFFVRQNDRTSADGYHGPYRYFKITHKRQNKSKHSDGYDLDRNESYTKNSMDKYLLFLEVSPPLIDS